MIDVRRQKIIQKLSEEIAEALTLLNSYQTSEGVDPDRNDASIKECKQKVVQLRLIRDELEHIFFGGTL